MTTILFPSFNLVIASQIPDGCIITQTNGQILIKFNPEVLSSDEITDALISLRVATRECTLFSCITEKNKDKNTFVLTFSEFATEENKYSLTNALFNDIRQSEISVRLHTLT